MLRAASGLANFAAPPAIGSGTPNAGSFTSLVTTGAVTFGGTVRSGGYTVATLPAGSQGVRTFVTDALAPAFLAAVVGGGTAISPVFHNGTQWVTD